MEFVFVYRLQGYTDKPVPTHHEIQKCLVDIGDKESKFIGSKQWIGSTEVSFVLESLYNIQSRILTASSGQEMVQLASDLAYHFETQGTPVMIGKIRDIFQNLIITDKNKSNEIKKHNFQVEVF